MAEMFYGWWRKYQLIIDVRMLERMVLFYLFMCYLFKVILFFKLFSYSSVCVGAKPCEKDKLGVGGS